MNTINSSRFIHTDSGNKTIGFCVDMKNEVAVAACLECQNRQRNTWEVLLIQSRAV